ncbi:MAG: hypothetical protein ABR927_02755 [Bacteroidales bacterium]|jgi:hypothetical protein
MENKLKIRYGWLKGMYVYTALGAGLSGLGIILMPETFASMWKMPIQDPIIYGIVGSVFLAFGLISILGLISPLKFAPILLLQMTYKIIWFIGVILPTVFTGQLHWYAFIFIMVFATYIIGDMIAIPFKYLLKKQLTE